MNRYSLIVLLAVGQLGFTAVRGQNDDVESFDRTPVNCIQVNRIRRTEVLDDQTILFSMRGGRNFLNHLPQECPTLEREGRFMYQTTGGQLCRIDTITVMERFGAGLGRGFTCRLGHFHPVTAEEIEELKELEEGGGRSEIEAEPVELDPEE
jgi:hypothetical protein